MAYERDLLGDAHNLLTSHKLSDFDRSSISPTLQPMNAFTFPSLQIHEYHLSQPEPSPRQVTPPAALGSHSVKMSGSYDTTSSVNSIDELSYDMVDDVSELSSDDHETVSIASTDARDEDENQELEYTNTEEEDVHETSLQDVPDTQTFKVIMPLTTGRHDQLLAESAFDDMETPRQSIITTKHSFDHFTHQKLPASKQGRRSYMAEVHDFLIHGEGLTRSLCWMIISCTVFYMMYWPTNIPYSMARNIQETSLRESITNLTGSSTIAGSANYTHLMNQQAPATFHLLSYREYRSQPEIHCQQLKPNYFLASLPKLSTYSITPISIHVSRQGREMNAISSKLIDGVYAVVIDPAEAHGLLTFDMTFTKTRFGLWTSNFNISVNADYGNSLLSLSTIDKARTDLSKAIAKDIAIAQHAAKTIGKKLRPDIQSRVQDMLMIVRSAVTDLSVFTNVTVNNLSNAEQKVLQYVSDAALALHKDMQHSLQEMLYDIKALSTFIPTAETLKQPILLSRERALIITKKLSSMSMLKKHAKQHKAHAQVQADRKALRHKYEPGQSHNNKKCKNRYYI